VGRILEHLKLSNQTIALLSKLTHEIRNSVGVVKVSDIVNDDQYAFNILIQAALSEDEALVQLTLTINRELNVAPYLIIALVQYFRDFKSRVKSEAIIQSNKTFLVELAHHVYGVNVEGASYRQAVDKLILDVDETQRHFCVDVSRSFYPYLVNASNTLTKTKKPTDLAFDAQKETLMDLWHEIESIALSSSETKIMARYIEAKRQQRLTGKEIDVRGKIAKVIMVEQRKLQPTPESYRENITSIQTLISSARLKDYILEVAREFYPFYLNSQPSE